MNESYLVKLLNIVIIIINNVMAYKRTITINFSFKLLGYYRDTPMENKSKKMQSLFLLKKKSMTSNEIEKENKWGKKDVNPC